MSIRADRDPRAFRRDDPQPLHIEILYNEYDFTAAFAASSLLALLAVVTLAAKHLIERSRPIALEKRS